MRKYPIGLQDFKDNWNWGTKNPVIHIRFSQMSYQHLGLEEAINRELDRLAGELGYKLLENNIKSKLTELIRKASIKGKVELKN